MEVFKAWMTLGVNEHTGRTLKYVARRSTALPTIMFCSALAMTRMNNAKENIHFSKPQNKDGIVSL